MKIIGIDFGSKRVGVAVGDSKTKMAFPKAVFPNDKFLIGEIKRLCDTYEAAKIVIGESTDFKGEKNQIMKEIESFKKMLEIDLMVPVIYEPEFMTSAQAARVQGENKMLDASAATIILQSYLDKHKKI